MSDSATTRTGLAYGVGAYLAWGFAPIYWKALAGVPAFEVVAHRVLWSALLLVLFATARRQLSVVRGALSSPRTLGVLAVTGALIVFNWLTFIWAVTHGQVLQASLGYYINPLLNVLLGAVVLGERLSRGQWLAVALAAVAVCNLAIAHGEFPWIALVLAFSFGTYGLLRKMVRVDALVGLTIETWLLLPLAAIYLASLAVSGGLVFRHGLVAADLLLVAGGFMTALPLLWFSNAVRRLRLGTVGFLQYIAPTLHFTLAVVVYREPFTGAHVVSFSLIWVAVAIYLREVLRAAGRRAA